MSTESKKGITVKVDAGLHAEVTQYLGEHGMTMWEFVTLALTNELHPKIQIKEEKNMENRKTLAFQVSEDLFLRIKEYLQRNNMTQKKFVIHLIERELDRDQAMREGLRKTKVDVGEEEENVNDDLEADSENMEVLTHSDELKDESAGFSMIM